MFHVKRWSDVSRETHWPPKPLNMGGSVNQSYQEEPPRPICDYEGSGYKNDFWEGQGREYEDLAERIALRELLPPRGRRLLEIGAGFGRMADMYAGYDQIVLLDFSRSLLQQAHERFGADPRFTFIAADLYDLPFFDGQFDAVVMIRVIHHLVDVPRALLQVQRVLAGDGRFILEFASKRHLKSMARYVLGRQGWSPFDRMPYEFVALNFDFHPEWMADQLVDAGLHIERERSLSHFRLSRLKRIFPASWLARLDGWIQPTGALWKLTPSVMLRARRVSPPDNEQSTLFRCLACGQGYLRATGAGLRCVQCGHTWTRRDGVYDLKSPNS
jgi:SAM-dependent methyltransferase